MENTKLFEKGARVAMVGDSITHSGMACAYVQEYYLSHMPEREVKIYNLGIGGDTASGACRRIDEIMAVEPTEAVVMFGVNDMGVQNYHNPTPTEEELAARRHSYRVHVEGTLRLVSLLRAEGLRVTLCSAVGRDEHTPGDGGYVTFGATDALAAMYHDNLAGLAEGDIKHTVDYLTPMQELQAALVAAHGPSLFAPDRTHPTELGQQMMGRILLRAQGLPVSLPTAEDFMGGWRERVLPLALRERRHIELRIRDLHWVHPHQADRVRGMDLEARIAFWDAESRRTDLSDYFINNYKNYVANARHEDEYFAEYMALTDALYGAAAEENGKIVKETLRI